MFGNSSKAASGRERRRAERMLLGTVGHMVTCPASSRTAPLTVTIADCSATGVGVIHTEPLPVGAKFVIKEPTISRRQSVLFTVVRADRIDAERFSIGLHASHLMENQHPQQQQRRGDQKVSAAAVMLILTVAAGVVASMYFL